MATRTENLTIRIDPKTKYLAQVAAAHLRISLSSLIDRSLLDVVKDTKITTAGESISIWDASAELYAEHEADRMVMLAERFDFLLTPDQQRIWEHVQVTQKYWLVSLSDGFWNVSKSTFNFPVLRADWDKLTAKYGKGGL